MCAAGGWRPCPHDSAAAFFFFFFSFFLLLLEWPPPLKATDGFVWKRERSEAGL